MIRSTDATVAEWHQLMLRWQAALENYERLFKEDSPSKNLDIEAAKQELAQIKRQINSLVATSGNRRGVRSEPFVVGVVELNDDAFRDAPAAPKMQAVKPKAVNS